MYREKGVAWGTACSSAALLIGGFAVTEFMPPTMGWLSTFSSAPFYLAVLLTAVGLWRVRTQPWTGLIIVLLFATSVFAIATFLLDTPPEDAAFGTLRVSAITVLAVIVPLLLDWQPFYRRRDKVRFPRRGWKPGVRPRRRSIGGRPGTSGPVKAPAKPLQTGNVAKKRG